MNDDEVSQELELILRAEALRRRADFRDELNDPKIDPDFVRVTAWWSDYPAAQLRDWLFKAQKVPAEDLEALLAGVDPSWVIDAVARLQHEVGIEPKWQYIAMHNGGTATDLARQVGRLSNEKQRRLRQALNIVFSADWPAMEAAERAGKPPGTIRTE